MPIKGLTDSARLPQLGHIRKGAPKDKNRPGKDLDFFRFEALSDEDGHLYDRWAEAYGSQPRRIEVEMPYATTDECFDAWMEEYTASALQKRCDGERCILYRKKNGEIDTSGRPCSETPCECQRVGRLHLLLPIFPRLATVVLTTSSIHDIRNLSGALRRYERMARAAGGDLRGIVFYLSRVPRKITTPSGDGGRARRTKHLVTLEPAEEWVEARRYEQRVLQLAHHEDVRRLAGQQRQLPGEVTVGHIDEEDRQQLISGLREGGDVQPSDVQPGEVQPSAVQPAAATVAREPEGIAPDGRPEADPTAAQELVILMEGHDMCRDRAQRLTLLGKLAGYPIGTTKELSQKRLDYCERAVEYIIEQVPEEELERFVSYVLGKLSPQQMLTDERQVGGWVRDYVNLLTEAALAEEEAGQ